MASFDEDPSTKPEIGKTIGGVKEGIDVIKDATVEEKADEDVPVVPVPAPEKPEEISLKGYPVLLAVCSADPVKDEKKEDKSEDSSVC